jgi:NADH dehydrogenase (ubiquinone) 1 alpha subcomplex subunit 13
LGLSLSLCVCGAGRRSLKQERAAARQALVPLLTAEEDRKYLQWKAKADKEEEALMGGVRGYTVGARVYHTERWVPPAQVAEH